jgi:CRISPR-associated protein Cmr5
MAKTLDQQRAAYAWERVSKQRTELKDKEWEKYRALAKGAPALIMNSGLMPTLAFYKSKEKEKAPEELLNDVAAWFGRRFAGRKDYHPMLIKFEDVMNRLHQGSSAFYMETTDEALEILKWIRQFVDAVPQGGNDHA